MKKILFSALLLILAAGAAWAQPNIEVDLSAEIEVRQLVDGKEVLVRLPAEAVAPGQTIFYALHYRNTGTQAATGVRLVNPIPPETTYLVGSAWGEAGEITFSIDGGQTYKQPTLLTYEVTGPDGSREEVIASPEQYTHIQWPLAAIPAGTSGKAGFQARVK
jgi:uncharacterized repeat protein (TIGR01451 family)